jgi:signal transduction histidine kinase
MTAQSAMIPELVKAFEIANIEMLVVSMPKAEIVEATTSAVLKWHCERSDVIGKSLQKFGLGNISARYIADQHNPKGPQNIEIAFAHPLGERFMNLFRQQPWTDGATEFMILIGQHASSEQSELAINNEKRLNLALRSGGYAVWDYDYETGKTYNSPEMFDLLGLPPDSTELDFNSFNSRVHPDDADLTLDQKIKTSPFGADVLQTRYRVRLQNNEYCWIESVAGIIRNPSNGKPTKCVGLCRNVSDQMVALERMRNSERTLKRSQQAAKLGSFSLRVESGVSRLSAEMAVLIGMENAIVHPSLSTFIKMIEPGDKERFEEALELAKIGRGSTDVEITVRLKSGDLEYFQVTLQPEKNKQGEIETVFGSCQCVTDRKALERKFHQAQKMEAVGQLTGGVAHDFNNLLMVVMGNLQLVEQLVKHDERAMKRIRAAIEAADKGSELTKRMLAFSRQQTLQNKEVGVNDLMQKMGDMLHHAVSATVDVQIIPNENVWSIKADSTMLETALLNLAINARDAMAPNGGKLIYEYSNITLDEEYVANNDEVTAGDYVQIAVTDTGCGIPPENIEKVFQPFFTTKPPEAGSGLGLSMIYGFVKQSGGHIKIYSEVGHGTTIKLYLPRMKQAAGLNDAPTPSDLQAHIKSEFVDTTSPTFDLSTLEDINVADHKMLVLVVEDNDSVREVAAAMIEEMGFEVILACNGHEGLKLIETRPDIDLVLSDVIMAGGMNGPELATRALKVRPELRVLFMSGYAPGSVRQMQDLPDSIDLVNKPFTRNDLTEKVKKALAA